MDKRVYVKSVSKSKELCSIMDYNMIIYIEEFINKLNEKLKETNNNDRILTPEQITDYKIKYINKILEYKNNKKNKEKKIKENAKAREKKVNEKLNKSIELSNKLNESNIQTKT